jgi:hypothetical protein
LLAVALDFYFLSKIEFIVLLPYTAHTPTTRAPSVASPALAHPPLTATLRNHHPRHFFFSTGRATHKTVVEVHFLDYNFGQKKNKNGLVL